MRRLSLVAFAGLLVVSPAVTYPAGERPIPQDPDRLEQRYRDMLAWNRRTLVGAYEKVGRKDPRWDKFAREALEAAARVFSHSVDPVAYLWDIHNVTEAAIRFGCDDPLILYLHACSFHAHNDPGREEIVRDRKSTRLNSSHVSI